MSLKTNRESNQARILEYPALTGRTRSARLRWTATPAAPTSTASAPSSIIVTRGIARRTPWATGELRKAPGTGIRILRRRVCVILPRCRTLRRPGSRCSCVQTARGKRRRRRFIYWKKCFLLSARRFPIPIPISVTISMLALEFEIGPDPCSGRCSTWTEEVSANESTSFALSRFLHSLTIGLPPTPPRGTSSPRLSRSFNLRRLSCA